MKLIASTLIIWFGIELLSYPNSEAESLSFLILSIILAWLFCLITNDD